MDITLDDIRTAYYNYNRYISITVNDILELLLEAANKGQPSVIFDQIPWDVNNSLLSRGFNVVEIDDYYDSNSKYIVALPNSLE